MTWPRSHEVITSFVLVILVTALPARAQMASHSFYAGPVAGVVYPFGDNLGKGSGIGFSAGGVGEYMLSSNVGLGVDLVLNFFSSQTKVVSDNSWRIGQLGGHARYLFSPSARSCPFLTGGIGLYNWHVSVGPDSDDATFSDTDLGFNAGAGVILKGGGNSRVTIGGAVHMIATSGESSTYVNGMVGLLFPLGR
jgi:hypothetical protein